jgi:hypothetical protein
MPPRRGSFWAAGYQLNDAAGMPQAIRSMFLLLVTFHARVHATIMNAERSGATKAWSWHLKTQRIPGDGRFLDFGISNAEVESLGVFASSGLGHD